MLESTFSQTFQTLWRYDPHNYYC